MARTLLRYPGTTHLRPGPWHKRTWRRCGFSGYGQSPRGCSCTSSGHWWGGGTERMTPSGVMRRRMEVTQMYQTHDNCQTAPLTTITQLYVRGAAPVSMAETYAHISFHPSGLAGILKSTQGSRGCNAGVHLGREASHSNSKISMKYLIINVES